MNHHPRAIQEECMAKMELNRQEEYLNRIDRLKLMDDDFFPRRWMERLKR